MIAMLPVLAAASKLQLSDGFGGEHDLYELLVVDFPLRACASKWRNWCVKLAGAMVGRTTGVFRTRGGWDASIYEPVQGSRGISV